jgi:FkbM family methyltransferase
MAAGASPVLIRALTDKLIALPAFDRKASVIRRLLAIREGKPVRSRYGPVMISDPQDATNFFCLSGLCGPDYDDVFEEVAQIEAGMAFIDVGANAGLFSLVASERVGRDGLVLAFEPSIQIFSRLIENAKLNAASNVYPFNAALGATTGVARFNSAHPSHSGIAHLDNAGDVDVVQLRFDAVDAPFRDLIGNRRTIIKIDVEGAELQVLDGMVEFIRQPQVEQLIVEIDANYLTRFDASPRGIYELLADSGFEPRRGVDWSQHYNEVFDRR